MNYPEMLRDLMAMSILDNPKKLSTLFSEEAQVFSKEVEELSKEASIKIAKEFEKEEPSEELKKLDTLLDDLPD